MTTSTRQIVPRSGASEEQQILDHLHELLDTFDRLTERVERLEADLTAAEAKRSAS